MKTVKVKVRFDKLNSLKLAIDLSEGSAIFFVLSSSYQIRKELKELLRNLLKEYKIIEIKISPKNPLNVDALREQISPENKKKTVVFVDTEDLGDANIESFVPERVIESRKVLQDINYKREAIANLGVPIVFFVNGETLKAFSIWAADLFSANSGVFEFESDYITPEGLQLQFTEKNFIELKSWFDKRYSLPRRELEARIKFYNDILRREISKRQPHLPYIASLRVELAKLHHYLGNLLRSVEEIKKAVEIYRKLAKENPDAFMPDLAMSLNNLGARLSYLGKREEALEVTREAVEIYRKLAKKNPDAFMPDLAMSLNNLGTMLSDLGKREEALEVTREAVEIYRKLAEKNPDAFMPYLATSFNNLGLRLSDLGRREEALEVTREAVEIRRKLAKENPDAFMPGLSRSLGSYALALLLSGKPKEAVRAIEEAIKILMPYAKAIPQVFGGLMSFYIKLYLEACAESGMEPDPELLNQAKEFLPEK